MKKFFLPLLLLVIVLGLTVPWGSRLKPLLPFMLAVLLFFNFYSITFERKQFFQKELLYYFVVVLVLLPAIVFFITRSVSPMFRTGLFLTAITPVAISSPVVVKILDGNMALSVANTVLYNLLSPLSYTLLTSLYFKQETVSLPFETIVLKLLFLIFTPFTLALVAKRCQRLTQPLRKIASYVNVLFLLLVFTAISASASKLRTIPVSELLSVFLFVVGIAGFLYATGYLLGKDMATKRALAVGMGQKNNSLCVWLALSNFGPLAAIPPTVYIVVHHLFNSLLIFLAAREQRAER